MASSINADNGVSSGSAGLKSSADSSGVLQLQTNGTTAVTIDASQNVSFTNQPTYSGGTANGVAYLNGSKALTTGTALTFDGTNLGVGTTSSDLAGGGVSTRISSNNGTGYGATNVNTGTATYSVYQLGNSNTANRAGLALFGSAYTSSGLYRQDGAYLYSGGAGGVTLSSEQAQPIYFATSNTERMRLDSAGNLGLGATPSAWVSGSRAIQIGDYSSIGQQSSGSGIFTWNAYQSASGFKYLTTNPALLYQLGNDGVYRWYQAGSGTAGNAITFTQAMTLDASGNWILGGTTARTRLTLQAGEANAPTLGTASGGAFFGNSNVTYGTMFGTSGAGYGWIQQQRVDGSATAYDLCLQPSGGNLLVGTTSVYTTAATPQIASKSSSPAGYSHFVLGNSTQGYLYVNIASAYNWNSNDSVLFIGRQTTSSRSINAAGSVNASGADYAEYMTKAGDFTVAKGDVVGINADGKLTNVFADAVSFAVKSTDPSYVGGDVWGSEEALGLTKPTDESTQEEKDAFKAALEAARQKVDRIAFAGQVPVNVMGATAGQYIIPVSDNGVIKGEAVSNPTFEQYQTAVGKVIAIESDGRAKIIVKVA